MRDRLESVIDAKRPRESSGGALRCHCAERAGGESTVIALALVACGILLMNVYALALLLLRGPLFRTSLYRPMLLNIGLSLAPGAALAAVLLLLVLLAVVLPVPAVFWSVIVVGGILWLLALPNSAYLITELNFSHRRADDPVPLWYDIVMVLALALSGVLNTMANVALVQLIVVLVAIPNDAHPLAHAAPWVFAGVVLILVSLGMYLGRYVRFNSWDIAHPAAFAGRLAGHFRSGAHVREAIGFCLTHSLLLALVYMIVVAPVAEVLN